LVEVRIREDDRKRLSSFFAEGHAGWADDGQDVVCAAVSAILQSAWLGLAEVARVEVTGTRSKGTLEFTWPDEERARGDVAAIVETAARSLERIALQFPSNVRAIRERTEG
jgi:uncharacterized protein YsxB (DUF464 family)